MGPRRPDPARWVWYAFGGGLGPRYRKWVLHDVTTRTWWVRHVARTFVQLTPVAVLLLIVLGPGWITWGALLAGLLLALIYSAAYIDETAEHRLVKHGYPSGTGRQLRADRDPAKNAERIRRYEQTYRNET